LDFRVVEFFLGKIAAALSLVLLPPLLMSMVNSDGQSLVFALTILACVSVFVICRGWEKLETERLSVREGIAVTGLCWLMSTLLGMLPFWLGGSLGLVDGIFESISGFTGTGATVITAIESLPESVLLWRSMTHCLGGLGIVVIFIAVLPQQGHNAVYMYNAEVSAASGERVLPRLKSVAKALFQMYILFTFIAFFVYLLGGMEEVDALHHAFSTIAAGGFSSFDSSAILFDSWWLELWMAFFMILAGGNFGLYIRVYQRGWRVLLKSEELRWYLTILAVATGIILLVLVTSGYYSVEDAFRYGVFQVASIATTGFVSDDYDLWPPAAKCVLLVLMITGGCAGSTAAGLKISRVVVLVKAVYISLWQRLHPQGVRHVMLDGHKVGEEGVVRATRYFFAYIMCIVFFGMLAAADGINLFDSIGMAITIVGNVGPGFGVVGATSNYAHLTPHLKLALCVAMLLGRLEIFTVLVMLRRDFWHKSKGW